MITIEDMNKLSEENFCLKFELNALADLFIRNESERMVSGFSLEVVEHDHLERYKLVLEYSNNKSVLEVACGTGYGSYLIATKGSAQHVFACDISEQAIRYASHRFKNEKINFLVQNAEKLTFDREFDLVISFETIEHLTDYDGFLQNIRRCLKINGLFIISTPIADKDIIDNPSNPYHTREWGFKYFQEMISKFFLIEKIYTQIYQNELINDEILKSFKESNDKSVKTRIVRKLRKLINGKAYEFPVLLTDWKARQNYSKIEEFHNQFAVSDLGKKYTGYQILVCRKNEK